MTVRHEETTTARILIIGATEGLGLFNARTLTGQGHDDVLHPPRPHEGARHIDPCPRFGRHRDRWPLQRQRDPLGRRTGWRDRSDAIIHNAGVYDGAAVLPVNVVAPICPPY